MSIDTLSATTAEAPTDTHAQTAPLPRVVLCGSFRRDPAGLRAAFDALSASFELTAPRAIDFVDASATFVRLEDEVGAPAAEIEQRHLDAIASADFVWLHAPEGYVGTSASLEIGHAKALGVPVFTDTAPQDEVLASMVHLVDHPTAVRRLAVIANESAPGAGIAALQNYYGRAAARRGWAGESARDTLLLLTEELGELARAVRKGEGLSRAGGYEGADIELEVADVQLYLVHLANVLGVDLASAVAAKERINSARATAGDRLTA
jgi:NTP pyrophosphatase (non-canonical NTP hydrolase)